MLITMKSSNVVKILMILFIIKVLEHFFLYIIMFDRNLESVFEGIVGTGNLQLGDILF